MNEHWEAALSDLRGKLSNENYETWLAPIRLDGFDGTELRLRIPNRFFADWVRTHYLDVLLESLAAQGHAEPICVDWVVDPTLEPAARPSREPSDGSRGQGAGAATVGASPAAGAPARSAEQWPPARNGSRAANQSATNLNPRYSFDNFIVGPSNQLAHAAAIAAASSPGGRYNPLFIYGGVGLGKTHLVNAVGHNVLGARPEARILYVSAERFTNEFIWALQNHRINEFRDRYRNQCDVLLMDDIQFLAGREQTQEEFFHTFNSLYHTDKQIVVSSDVYPKQIGKMEERLVSRFQWGMVADIQAPELDTRVAIVRKKAEQEGIDIAQDVAHFLAQSVKSNVRELEGTLLRLAVKADLMRQPIDLAFARNALQTVIPKPELATTVEDIQRAVCEYFNIRLTDLKSHRRHRSVAHPRMIAMYLCRQRLNTSYSELGDRFGGKDHTTVMNAVRRIGHRIEGEDLDVLASVEAIEFKLGGQRKR